MDELGALDESGSPRSLEPNANADNRAVARNALTGYAAWGVNLAIGFLVTPVLLHGLGVDGFGAWTLAMTIASYVGMVELGLGVATIRHVAGALAATDKAQASIVAASARATYLVMAGFGAILLVGLVTLPGVLVETGDVSSDRVRLAVLVLGLGFLLSLTASVYPAIAIGAGRTDLGVAVGMAVRVTMAVLQVIVVLTSGSLVALAVVTASGVAGGTFAVRAVTRRRFGEIDVRLANANRPTARLLLASGWRNAAIGIAVAAAIQSDVLVVGVILGPAAVAAYGIAVRASIMVHGLATRASDVLVPTFAHATALDDRSRTLNALRESVFLIRATLVPALVTFVIFGDSLLQLWLGEVPTDADLVLVLLVLGALVAAPGHSAFVLLTGMNRLNYLLIGASVTAVANLGVSILLTLQFGIVGPVLGSLVGFVIWDMLVLPRHVGSVLGIAWLPLSFGGLRLLVLPAASATIVAWALADVLGWDSPVEGLAGAVITCLAYLGVLSLTVGAERRARYRRLFAGAVKREARAT